MTGHVAIELLSSYLDKEVTPRQLRVVETHLEGCPKCRQTLDGLRSVAEGVRRLEAMAPPPTLGPAVERRLRFAVSEKPRALDLERVLKRWIGQPVLAPAFAVVLALGAIVYLFAHGLALRQQRPTRVVVASVPAQQVDEFESVEPGDAARVEGPALENVSAEEMVSRESIETGEPESRVVARSAPGPVPAAVPSEVEASVREIAGRTFVRAGRVWIERGLEREAAAEIVDLSAGPSELEALLSPYSDLGRVRLLIEGRVVEVVYRSGSPR